MKRQISLSFSLIGLLIGFAIHPFPGAAQTTAPNEWTWMGGNNKTECTGAICWPAVVGTQGVFAAANTPGSLAFDTNWTDKDGNFWLGANVLFEYKPALGEWAWISGAIESPCDNSDFCGWGVY